MFVFVSQHGALVTRKDKKEVTAIFFLHAVSFSVEILHELKARVMNYGVIFNT